MGLFTRKAIYNDFTIAGGRGHGELFAHFASAVKGRDLTLPAPALRDALRGGGLHPHDRDLFALALDRLQAMAEERALENEYNTAIEQREAREKRTALMLEMDGYDLRAPERPFRRHLQKDEPPRRYKSHSLLTGTPENIRAALKLVRPEMIQSYSPRMLSPRFAMEFDEHRLLYEHRNNGHLNYDDKVVVHDALRELRAYKIRGGLPVIPLRAAPAEPAPPRPRGHLRIFY